VTVDASSLPMAGVTHHHPRASAGGNPDRYGLDQDPAHEVVVAPFCPKARSGPLVDGHNAGIVGDLNGHPRGELASDATNDVVRPSRDRAVSTDRLAWPQVGGQHSLAQPGIGYELPGGSRHCVHLAIKAEPPSRKQLAVVGDREWGRENVPRAKWRLGLNGDYGPWGKEAHQAADHQEDRQ